MRNDVSLEKTRAFKSKPKLFYEKFFYFVSIALGSLQKFTFVFYVMDDLFYAFAPHQTSGSMRETLPYDSTLCKIVSKQSYILNPTLM